MRNCDCKKPEESCPECSRPAQTRPGDPDGPSGRLLFWLVIGLVLWAIALIRKVG